MGYAPGMRDTVHHAMILAAGFGTRLKPFTLETPKPLLEVMGRPLIHYALHHAQRAGCRRVVINTHHLGDQIEATLGDRFGDIELRYSHEDTILGTGGGIRQMAEHLDLDRGAFLILNSDALCDFDVHALCRAHHQCDPIGTLLLKTTADQDQYGTLGTDEAGDIVRFVERATLHRPEAQRGMFVGAHVMDPRLLDYLPLGEESCVNTIGYPRALEDGHRLVGCYTTGSFSDVGTPGRLMAAHRGLFDGSFSRAFLPADPARGGRISPQATLLEPVVVGEGAEIQAGATVGPRVVVGDHAVVQEGAQVSDSVLFLGAEVLSGETVRHEIRSAHQKVVVEEETKSLG